MKRFLPLLLSPLLLLATGFDYVTNTYNVTNSVASKQYKDFTWTWSGYDDQRIVVNIPTTIIGTLSNMHMRLAAPRGPRGTVYLEMGATAISSTSASYSVSRTNLPPSGRYFVEALHYAVTPTSEPTRVMAKGKGQVEASVYSATNQASWVNPLAGMVLGPPTHIITNDASWPFQLKSGSLTLADDNWVGLGASAGRVEFDDTTIDLVEVLAANVRVGNGTPARATAAEALYVEGAVEVDAAIYADGGLSVDVISEDPSLTRGVTIDGVVLSDSGISVGGSAVIDGALDLGTVQTFADGDGTPDVSGGAYFNTHSSAETITDFDGSGIVDGQVITVFSKGATTFDDGGLLRAGSVDLVTANGDMTTWMYDGTDWVLLSFMDDSINASLSAYRLGTADHTHASTGAQAGKIDHGTALNGLGDDDHSLYLQNTEISTSSELAGLLDNETGSGLAVFGTSPTLSAPYIEQQWVDYTGAGAETMTAAESKFGFITVDTAKTINLVGSPVAGMTFTILVTADVVVTIDGAGEDVWMDGSTDSSDPEDIVNSGSAGECISLFWDGTAWRAHHVEGSWTI